MASVPDRQPWQDTHLPVRPPGSGRGKHLHPGSAIAAVGLAAAIITSAAVLGCSRSKQQKSHGLPRRPATSAAGTETKETPVARDYQFVNERNLFRPLVVAPKGEGGGSGEVPPPRPDAGGASAAAQSPSAPPRPPDPTADLAITGVTETTDGLRALIEKLSTHQGQYVRVGDMAFGFTVQSIGRGAVTLAQGEKEYELKLGEKEIAAATPTTPQTTASPATQTASATSSSSPGSSPSFGGGMDWRNMSPEQRQRAMEERRRWWEGLSESERDRYRSGLSRGSGRGSDRGPGRGPGR